MPHGPSFDAKEQVRQATDIVDLVGSYASLRRSGRNYVALCPWHDDSRPSLQVNPQRQSFKCWVCDIGGDVFSFLMKMENVEFPEALAMLADRAGISLAPASRGPGADSGGAMDAKRGLYQAMAWAASQYHGFLCDSPAAELARQYFAERGITAESVRRFQLGFAPDEWSWLLERARQTDFSPKVLESVGLVAKREGAAGHYDRFRGRVLFSIRDAQGRPVGLGGRVLPALGSASPAKYINSPETPLFAKSSLLYGLDLAKDAITKTKTALIVEGYTDTIIAHQAGFPNTVAVLGTALGERHIQLLKRYADRIILVLDGDAAGQRRTNEVLELFVMRQVDMKVLTLPDGLDPCDFLLQRGADAFRELLSGAVDALEHHFRAVTRGVDLQAGTHAVHQAIEEVLSTLAKAPRLTADTPTSARLLEEQILHRLSRNFAISEEVLRERLTALRRGSRRSRSMGPETSTSPETESSTSGAELNSWERELLEILVGAPEHADEILSAVGPDFFQTPMARQIILKCRDLMEVEGQISFARLMLEFDEPQVKGLLVDLDERGHEKMQMPGSTPAQRLGLLLDSFRRGKEDSQVRAHVAALREQGVDDREGLEIFGQVIQQNRIRRCISEPTDG